MTETLRLDDEHRYWLGSERVLGVSEVLKDNGFVDARFFTERDRSRGQAVHHALNLELQGKLDRDTLHKDLHGYLDSGLRLLEHFKSELVVVAIEQRLYHPIFRYAGTVDLRLLWKAVPWIWDWKTGEPGPASPFQLGGYEGLVVKVTGFPYVRRAAVCLHEDGRRATLREYAGAAHLGDSAKFLAFLTTTRCRQAAGIKGEWTHGQRQPVV